MESQGSIVDKRTLLAFALMFLVWFGWIALFPSPETEEQASDEQGEVAGQVPTDATQTRPVREPERRGALPQSEPIAHSGDRTQEISNEEGTDASSELGPDERGARSGARSGWLQWEESERGEPIVVESEHYVARIDPVGGDLLQWTLKDYQQIDGSNVELVNSRSLDEGTQRAHALRLIFDDHSADLRRVRFEADRQHLSLDADHPEASLRLRAQREDGGVLELLYHFSNDRYGFDLRSSFSGVDTEELPLSLDVSWPGGIASSEPDTVSEYREFKAVARLGTDIQKIKFGSLQKGNGAKGRRSFDGTLSWAGAMSKYFLAGVISPAPRPGFVRFGGDGDRHIQTFEARLAMERSRQSVLDYSVFLGPVEMSVLRAYDAPPYEAQLSKLVDIGPAIFRPVSVVTLAGLKFMRSFIPNWGLVIILFSTMTKLLFYPLTKSGTQSQKRMQELQPKLAKLKEKFKDDQQKQSEEMFRLYKEHGVNPVGGCLPLLVQMPVFYALFTILRKTIDLRQAGFAFWIDDLSRPDVLFHLPFTLPVLGDKFCVLPFLMAGSMWLQTKMSQPAGAPAAGGGGAMATQMRMMGTFMPIMMFVFFYNSPSGLVLYWLVNTILTAFQTWRIHSTMAPVGVSESAQPA